MDTPDDLRIFVPDSHFSKSLSHRPASFGPRSSKQSPYSLLAHFPPVPDRLAQSLNTAEPHTTVESTLARNNTSSIHTQPAFHAVTSLPEPTTTAPKVPRQAKVSPDRHRRNPKNPLVSVALAPAAQPHFPSAACVGLVTGWLLAGYWLLVTGKGVGTVRRAYWVVF